MSDEDSGLATVANCRSLLAPNQDVGGWIKMKRAFIKSFIKDQAAVGTEAIVLDHFFSHSGVGLYIGRNIITGYDPASNQPPYSVGAIAKASIQAHIKANTLATLGSFSELIFAMGDGEIKSDTMDHNWSRFSSLNPYSSKRLSSEVGEELFRSFYAQLTNKAKVVKA